MRRLGEGEGRKLLLLGDVRTIKAGGPEARAEGSPSWSRSPLPARPPRLHRHPYQEVFYVLEGELEFTGLADGERDAFAVGAGGTRPCRSRCRPRLPQRRHRPRPLPRDHAARGSRGLLRGGRASGSTSRAARRRTRPAPSPDAVLEAAARHGIEFLTGP